MDKGARAARLADLLRDYLATWIHEDYPGRLVTVSDIQLSSNKQQATVWLSSFDQSGYQAAVEISTRSARYQHLLHTKLDRRAIPLLHFVVEPLA